MSGRFEPIRKIGSGGMARVTLARHYFEEGVSMLVTLKQMLPQDLDDRDMRLMFLDEARLQAELSHPNIVRALGFEVIEQIPTIVLEWVDGPNLRDLLHGARIAGGRGLPPRVTLTIAIAIAEALAYAHELHGEAGDALEIVHRDVNPSNVLVGYNGMVKLGDFGIARAESHAHITRTGVLKGTLAYMAPEQLEREAPIDFRADLYSLAVTLHEVALGELPFGPMDEVPRVDHPARAGYRVGDRLTSYPPTLSALLESCLSADPAARPSSTRAVTRALRDIVSELGGPVTMTEMADLVRAFVPADERTVVAPNAAAMVAAALEAATTSRPQPRSPSVVQWLLLAVALLGIAIATYLLGRTL